MIEVEGVNVLYKDRAASTRLGYITADSEGNFDTLQHSQKIVDKIKKSQINSRLRVHTSTAEEQELEY